MSGTSDYATRSLTQPRRKPWFLTFMESLQLVHLATYLNAFNRRSIFALAPCESTQAGAALVIFEAACDYRARFPEVTIKQSTNWARDTFKAACARAIAACDVPGDYL